MIVDTFIFYNELDLLDLRLNILNPIVDKFLLIEADHTFSNKLKPFYYLENKEKFSKFNNKIISDIFKSNKKVITRENVHDQRNFIYNVLVKNIDLDDSDIIILSDLDEIPNPNCIKKYKRKNIQDIYSFDALMYYYYLNVRVDYEWQAIKIFRAKDLKKDLHSIRTSNPEYFENGGWHFSFVGGLELMKQKIDAFSHQELNTPKILDELEINMKELKEPFSRNAKIWKVAIDNSYPDYIRFNKDYFIKKGWILE